MGELLKGGIYNFYYLLANIVIIISSWRLWQAAHAVGMGDDRFIKNFDKKNVRKRACARPRHTWDGNTKMYLKIGLESVDFLCIVKDKG